MPYKKHQGIPLFWAIIILFHGICPVFGSNLRTLSGHVPAALAKMTPMGLVAGTNELQLAIGLPMRDSAGLDAFLAEVYNPASPNFHKWLTPDEIAARFGPTTNDYDAIKNFARSNGLAVTGTFGNRMVLDVTGPASAIERAFHVTLRNYHHPKEARNFFAPDTEPTVDAALPLADVQGLSDYGRPYPKFHRLPVSKNLPVHKDGSSPDGQGAYFGDDLRHAYAPGVTLTGAGQSIGLFEADAFHAADVAEYANQAGGNRVTIPIQIVKLDGFNGIPTSDANSEVALDIETAMAMAPGLDRIVVFEGNPKNYKPNDILNSMLASNSVKTLSCSWGWTGGPSTTTDNIFKNMQAAGQTFLDASGDFDAYTAGASSVNGVDNAASFNAPASCPFITQVGGTTLSMNGAGTSYSSESVWNWGTEFGSAYDGEGTGGGVSSHYSIPTWQTSVTNLIAVGGSTSFRNTPDVAAIGDNVYVVADTNQMEELGGTSCSAPVWAGFIALVNQKAASAGNPSVGFINPALYSIAFSNYNACFHDVTTGNNAWSSSPDLFFAQPGYDLCTGLGTPNGQNLIDALLNFSANNTNTANVGTITVSPLTNSAFGVAGGPFTISSATILLTNTSTTTIVWAIDGVPSWLGLSAKSGKLAAGGHATIKCGFATSAKKLAVGSYEADFVFSNRTTHATQPMAFAMDLSQPLILSPTIGFNASGPVGGPFPDSTNVLVLTNQSSSGIGWKILGTPAWMSLKPASGTIGGHKHVNITVTLGKTAKSLTDGVYSANLLFTNFSGLFADVTFTNSIGQPNPDVLPIGPPPSGFTWTWNVPNGQSFQFQYTTNLAQPDWTDLGGPVSTSNGTLIMQDPNPVTASPCRFYRIIPAP